MSIVPIDDDLLATIDDLLLDRDDRFATATVEYIRALEHLAEVQHRYLKCLANGCDEQESTDLVTVLNAAYQLKIVAYKAFVEAGEAVIKDLRHE